MVLIEKKYKYVLNKIIIDSLAKHKRLPSSRVMYLIGAAVADVYVKFYEDEEYTFILNWCNSKYKFTSNEFIDMECCVMKKMNYAI
jgi:hypothetical protein